jgi:hypothetical protein
MAFRLRTSTNRRGQNGIKQIARPFAEQESLPDSLVPDENGAVNL